MGILLLFSPAAGAPGALEATLTVEAAFGYGINDATPVYEDLTAYLLAEHGQKICTWEHGRDNELAQFAAGKSTVSILDENSHFDRRNTASPFYPYVKAGLPVRGYLTVTDTVTTVVYSLFDGAVERVPRTSLKPGYTTRRLEIVDRMSVLAKASLAGYSYPLQMSDERVTAVADDINWPAAKRQISAGQSILGAKAFAADDKQAWAQTHLLKAAEAESGLLFVDGAGDIVFIDRLTFLQDAAYITPAATFRDVSGSAGYYYASVNPIDGIDEVVNRFTGTREGSADAVVVEDAASQADFGIIDRQTESLLATDGDLYQQLHWDVSRLAQPVERIDAMTVRPFYDSQDMDQIDASLGREVGDRITHLETPPGFASEESTDYTVQRVSGQIVAGPLTMMEVTFGLGMAIDASTAWWLVGTAGRSGIGTSTVVGY